MPPPYNGNSNFNAKQNVERSSQDDWGGYIDVRLTNEDKLQFEAWYEANQSEWFGFLIDTLADGLKLGMMWDGGNSCYVATLNGRGVKTINKRFTLTARAGKFYEALALLCFKHYVMLEMDWGNWKPANKRQQDWG
jgi:hypothetical protein